MLKWNSWDGEILNDEHSFKGVWVLKIFEGKGPVQKKKTKNAKSITFTFMSKFGANFELSSLWYTEIVG